MYVSHFQGITKNLKILQTVLLLCLNISENCLKLSILSKIWT